MCDAQTDSERRQIPCQNFRASGSQNRTFVLSATGRTKAQIPTTVLATAVLVNSDAFGFELRHQVFVGNEDFQIFRHHHWRGFRALGRGGIFRHRSSGGNLVTGISVTTSHDN